MKLYQSKGNHLTSVKSQPFALEREIQSLVEANLEELFGLEFVRTEFPIQEFRLDTLAYDREANAFVIIEYKKDKNFSVIDQGYTYLSLMLNNQADFILEFNENKQDSLKRNDVDWTQSRVIFIAPQYTEYQKNSINFKDVPFELWEIKRYEDGLIGFLEHSTSSSQSISSLSADPENVVNKVSRKVRVYTEEFHFNKYKTMEPYVIDLYQEIKERFLSIGDDVEIIPRQDYIGFRRKRPFVDVVFYADHLRLTVNMKKGTLDDPKGMTLDMSNKGHWGNGDYEVRYHPDTDLDYVMFLIKQSYKDKE